MTNNWEIFLQKEEPLEVKNGLEYINLRRCEDYNRLESLAKKLKEANLVIVPWINRPFGTIQGYGTYTRDRAEELIRLQREESWSDPRLGQIYGLAWFERRLQKLQAINRTFLGMKQQMAY